MNINGYELYGRIVAHYAEKKKTDSSIEFGGHYSPETDQFIIMTRNSNWDLVFLRFKGKESFIFDSFKEGNSSVEAIVDIIGEVA